MAFAAVGSAVTIDTATPSLNPQNVGDFILMEVLNNGPYAMTGITGGGCTWTPLTQLFIGSNIVFGCQIWLGRVNTVGGAAATISFSGSPSGIRGIAQEFSSNLNGWVLDSSVDLDTSSDSFPAMTPAGTGELYFGYAWESGSSTDGTTPGYVYGTDGHANGFMYNVSCTSSAQQPTFGNTDQRVGQALLLREVPWAVLQSAVPASHGAGNVAATFGSNLSAGTKLIAYLHVSDPNGFINPSCTGVSDGNGNAFTKVVDLQSSGVIGPDPYYKHSQIWVLDTPAGDVGAAPTITATLSGSANVYGDMIMQEVDGLMPGANCLDGTAGTIPGSSTSDYSTGSPSYASSAANEYLVSFYSDNGGSGNPRPSWTAPGGLALDAYSINTQLYGNVAVACKPSSGGSESASWSVTTSTFDIWGAVTIAFKLRTWKVLQSFGSANFSGGPVNQALGSSLTAGSKLIAYIAQNGGNNAAAVAADDGNGNSFTQIFRQTWDWSGSSQYITLTILVLDTPAGDAGTAPTFNFTPSNSANITVALQEVTGLLTGMDCIDGTAGYTTGSIGGTGVTSTPTYSSTASGEYLVSAIADGWTVASISTPTGYATGQIWLGNGFGPSVGAAYGATSGGAETDGWNVDNNADHYVAAMVAFKPAEAPSRQSGNLLLAVFP